jgi:hypothetical protein
MDAFFLIVVLHITVIVPFLLWVGFNRAATPEWMYSVLFGAGIIVLVYHAYKGISRLIASSPLAWVNLIHVLIVAPLLIWIGYHAKRTERPAYDMLLLAAFGALGFHLYHGAWSIFQSLGSMSARFNPRHNPLRRGFAAGFAILVAGVNITFPIAVLTGVVG